MRNQVTYEWGYEITDKDGDIIDSSFQDKLSDFGKDHEGKLVLVRNEGNEHHGLNDRVWAYVEDGKLPVHFSNELGHHVTIKVPEKYKKELSAFLKS